MEPLSCVYSAEGTVDLDPFQLHSLQGLVFYLRFEQLEHLKKITEGSLDSVSNLWKRTNIFFRIHNICLSCKSLFHFCCLHAKLSAQQYASMWLYNTGVI